MEAADSREYYHIFSTFRTMYIDWSKSRTHRCMLVLRTKSRKSKVMGRNWISFVALFCSACPFLTFTGTGFIACAQIPLIILLAGKRNILGAMTGCGYERLNWLHRWTARCLLLTVVAHLGFWFSNWARFNYIGVKLSTDSITQYGMISFGLLGWLVFSSIAPFRTLSYEFFIFQHIISYLGFLVAVYFHVPEDNRKWVWIPLAIWGLDRATRMGFLLYNNLTIFHRKTRSGILTCRAIFEAVDEEHTRVTIPNPPITWKAGQHVFISYRPALPFTSHPFSIASLPSDGQMDFIIRAKKGATKRFFIHAVKQQRLLLSPNDTGTGGKSVLIEGPYARIRPLKQFDGIVFLAGSTGTTFTVPLMRDIVRQWMISAGLYTGSHHKEDLLSKVLSVPDGAVTRNIRFVWVVRKTEQVKWFQQNLHEVLTDVARLKGQGKDVDVEISLYVTSEDRLPNTPLRNSSLRWSQISTNQSRPGQPELNSNYDSLTVPLQDEKRASMGSTFSSTSALIKDGSLDPRIVVHYGRPELVTIIRQEAEKALGEMAVVVCGPPGMVRGARSAVSHMSDERGIHKGTGAQGIYVHAEMFGY